MSGRNKEAPPERCPCCKWGPNPYMAELRGDSTAVWLCQDCIYMLAEEV